LLIRAGAVRPLSTTRAPRNILMPFVSSPPPQVSTSSNHYAQRRRDNVSEFTPHT
jgi:hypothetical protein